MVDGTFTVTGGKAGDGTSSLAGASTSGDAPGVGGTGGYAGVAVPAGTTIIVTGKGTLVARGGDAGDGGMDIAGDIQQGSGGGGGAGAGIGGNGGAGGKGTGSSIAIVRDGKAGIAAGNIHLYGSGIVKAYGGAGGAGGSNRGDTGGGGGYPGAGIGGGGAGGGGGTYCPGGSGFTGASQENSSGNSATHDGVSGIVARTDINWSAGAGYFSVDIRGIVGAEFWGTIGGGGSGYAGNTALRSGSGGLGGAGGAVYKSNKNNLEVANGSYKTATKRVWGQNPTPIYMQSGFKLDMIREKGVTSVSARTGAALTQELKNKKVPQSVQPFSYEGKDIYGVGSGAGYTETSNGSYARGWILF